LSVLISGFTFAQEDLLKDIDTIKTKNTDTSQPAFKALQIVTGQSTKLPYRLAFIKFIKRNQSENF